jgi:hypothetical protein
MFILACTLFSSVILVYYIFIQMFDKSETRVFKRIYKHVSISENQPDDDQSSERSSVVMPYLSHPNISGFTISTP